MHALCSLPSLLSAITVISSAKFKTCISIKWRHNQQCTANQHCVHHLHTTSQILALWNVNSHKYKQQGQDKRGLKIRKIFFIYWCFCKIKEWQNMVAQPDQGHRPVVRKHNDEVNKNWQVLSQIIGCVNLCSSFPLALHMQWPGRSIGKPRQC